MSVPRFPPPPSNLVDWDHIGFKVRDVNGHVECDFSYAAGGKWSEPRWVTDPNLKISGLAPGLNYGQQVYEGLKCFRRPDGTLTIFRPGLNAARMRHSAAVVSIPEVPEDLFLRSVHLAVAANAEYVPPHGSGAAMYIRPLLFGSSPQLGLSPPDGYTFAVFVMPTGVYHGASAVDALILEDFDRSAPHGTGNAKIGGNYAPVLRHSEKARTQGYGITLHLDSATRSEIDEFSTSAFIGVKREGDSVTVVHPDSSNAIDSVTATSVGEIARALGFRVEKRRVPYEELGEFDEVFAAGTAASLVAIRSVSRFSRSDKFEYRCGDQGQGGDICVKLLRALRGIQNGTEADTFGWTSEVHAPPPGWIHEVGDQTDPSGLTVP